MAETTRPLLERGCDRPQILPKERLQDQLFEETSVEETNTEDVATQEGSGIRMDVAIIWMKIG